MEDRIKNDTNSDNWEDNWEHKILYTVKNFNYSKQLFFLFVYFVKMIRCLQIFLVLVSISLL